MFNRPGVMCHMSRVTSHMFFCFCFFGQSGEAYRWRVCYQRGLPRLVSFILIPVHLLSYNLYFAEHYYRTVYANMSLD